uniref:Uncharacterized protein n=1 Tax=Tetranychus urticae TaxID=32264 RepID=T1KR67_TETUR
MEQQVNKGLKMNSRIGIVSRANYLTWQLN